MAIVPYKYENTKEWWEDKATARDPSTDLEILVLLIDQHPYDVWDNPAFKLHMVLDPHLTFLTEHAFRRLRGVSKVGRDKAEFPNITLEGWKDHMIQIGKLNPG